MDGKEPDEEERTEDANGEPPATDEINPWKDIFFKPRATTRWLLAHETPAAAQTLWLSFTAFFIVLAFFSLMFFPGNFDRVWAKMQLVMLTPMIFLVSWGYFILGSYLLLQICRLLGGRAEVGDMRVVNAYTTAIPSVVFGIVGLVFALVFGRSGPLAGAFENITMIWALYIALSGISAATGLSPWRALAAYLSSVAIWMAVTAATVSLLKIVLPRLPALF